MARPTLLDIDHGQQSWDADINLNTGVLRDQSIPVPEYADFASLPAPGSNDRCLVATIDTNTLWFSDGSRWLPKDGFLLADNVPVATVGAAAQTLKTFQFPADFLVIGDQLEIVAWGSFDDATESGNAFFKWGGTGGTTIGFGEGFNGQSWRIQVLISVRAAAEQESNSLDTYVAVSQVTHTSLTELLNATIDLLVRGDNIDGSNNDAVTVRGFNVKLIPARP